MAGLGRVCLLLGLAVCVYGAGASIYGARSGRVSGAVNDDQDVSGQDQLLVSLGLIG